MGKIKTILTEYPEYCCCCKKRMSEAGHHMIFGKLKPIADEYKLILPVCNSCHNMSRGTEQIHGNPRAEDLSKIAGQLAFEKEYYKDECGISGDPAREEFRRVFGESFL